MGQHRTNPVAIANAVPQRSVDYLKLADGFGLLGIGLEPHMDENGNLHVFLMATCARVSDLMPINKLVKVALGEPAKISVADLCGKISEALGESKEKEESQ